MPTCIDCSKNITEARIKKFITLLTSKSPFILKSDTNQQFYSIDEFASYLRDVSLNDDILIFYGNDDLQLVIGSQTLQWWRCKNERWLSLFPSNNIINVQNENVSQIKTDVKTDVKKNTSKDLVLAYSVAIANIDGNKLSNISSCMDTKKNVIEWLNNEIAERVLTSFMKTDVVINVCYDGSKDNDNLDLWFTVKELEEMGVVVVK